MMILAQSLFAAWLALRWAPRQRTLCALVAALLVQVPFWDGLSLAMAMRGLVGDPSITTLQLLVLALAGRTPAAITHGWAVPAAILLPGLLLYPATLGALDIEVYRLGYQPWALVAVVAIPALLAWWRGHPLALWLLTIDLLVFAAGLAESPNLWDSLIDPLLFIAAFVLLIRYAVRKLRSPARHEA